jgi:hypothetical protein
VSAVFFENTENTTYYTDKSGILAFDENFYPDTEYGAGTYDPAATFVGNNGGGLVIKNEDGWGAIFTSQNTRWAKGYWNSLVASGGVEVGGDLDVSGSISGGGSISGDTGVFTGASDGNVLLVGTGGKLGLTINDGDGNANLTFNHASQIPDQNGSAGRIDCGVDGTNGYMRLRVKNSVTAGSSYSLPECFRIEEEFVRAYADLYVDDNLGVGTTNPYAKLHVNGDAGALSVNHSKYFSAFDSLTWKYEARSDLSIYASGIICSASQFLSHTGTISASDTRIKKNIVDADDVECLETLRLLKPKKYQYKDAVARGEEPVWGFIAQEVRDTLPYATQLRRDVLPNIYELANVSQSNVITFTNFNTSNLESNATTLIRTKGIDDQDHDIHLVEVIDEHTIRVEEDLSDWTGSVDAEGNVITQIETTTLTPEEYEALKDTSGYVANISGYQNANVPISVEEYNALEDTTGYEAIIENYTKTITIYPGTQLFVYGQEVDDFIFVKKEAIWTIATAALQEVDRQLQAEKARNDALEARILALENA